MKFEISCEMVADYFGTLIDLNHIGEEKNRKRLRIRERCEDGSIYIEDLIIQNINSAEEFSNLLNGNVNQLRRFQTYMSAHIREFSVFFKINLVQHNIGTNTKVESNILFVSLHSPRPEYLTRSRKHPFFYIRNCLDQLHKGAFVPYRDAPITRLLRDSISLSKKTSVSWIFVQYNKSQFQDVLEFADKLYQCYNQNRAKSARK